MLLYLKEIFPTPSILHVVAPSPNLKNGLGLLYACMFRKRPLIEHMCLFAQDSTTNLCPYVVIFVCTGCDCSETSLATVTSVLSCMDTCE